ncbi:MAG: MaoC family dehydratase [Deltaproteobacteria bacterium]|nr:MaoC family dehydratase [Deltaproteobacteria bacterium]
MAIYQIANFLLHCNDWLEIDRERIDQFAACTDDYQCIHVDEARAAKSPFGRTIAHGFLLLSLVNFFRCKGNFIPETTKMSVNYGLNRVWFLAPVAVGSRIRDRAVLSGVERRSKGRVLVTVTHTLEIENEEKPACVADVLSLFYV